MLHNDRQWHITQAGSPEELATLLTEHTWCPSQGFRLGAYLYADRKSADEAGPLEAASPESKAILSFQERILRERQQNAESEGQSPL